MDTHFYQLVHKNELLPTIDLLRGLCYQLFSKTRNVMATLPNTGGALCSMPQCGCAVTLPRRKTHWNLTGCPKLTKQSQPLVGRSSPYCKDMWGRYCCLTSFIPIVNACLSCEDIAQQSCAMVRRWRFFCIIFASCISSEPRAAYFRPAF